MAFDDADKSPLEMSVEGARSVRDRGAGTSPSGATVTLCFDAETGRSYRG